MTLLFRTFRVKSERYREAECSLVAVASAVIRELGAETVLIFRVANDPMRFMWLDEGGSDADLDRLAALSGAVGWLRGVLAQSDGGYAVRLLEEYHRTPCILEPPCHLWALEVDHANRPPDELADQVREARRDCRVVGTATDHALEAARTVAFLALSWGVTPASVGLGLTRHRISGHLTVVVDGRRLACEAGAAADDVPHWIRESPSPTRATCVRSGRPVGAKNADRWAH